MAAPNLLQTKAGFTHSVSGRNANFFANFYRFYQFLCQKTLWPDVYRKSKGKYIMRFSSLGLVAFLFETQHALGLMFYQAVCVNVCRIYWVRVLWCY